jgi:uncharacterized membrane protein
VNDWDLLGQTHLAAAIVAMASGAGVLLTKKGARRHRRLGWVYVCAMAAVNVTALLIYELFGGFGPFHVAALVSGVTVIAGLLPAVRRWPRAWVEYHAHWMVWSYIGLTAAAVSEVSTRYLDVPFGSMVIMATAFVVLSGAVLVWVLLPRTLRPFTRRPPAPS